MSPYIQIWGQMKIFDIFSCALKNKLSKGYVGVDVWLWKVHPLQLNLKIFKKSNKTILHIKCQTRWYCAKRSYIDAGKKWQTCLFVKPKLSNLTWQYCSSTGNLNDFVKTPKAQFLLFRCASISCTNDRHWLTGWLIETGYWQFITFDSSPTASLGQSGQPGGSGRFGHPGQSYQTGQSC